MILKITRTFIIEDIVDFIRIFRDFPEVRIGLEKELQRLYGRKALFLLDKVDREDIYNYLAEAGVYCNFNEFVENVFNESLGRWMVFEAEEYIIIHLLEDKKLK